jgi:iron complex outermembrane recepter protein
MTRRFARRATAIMMAGSILASAPALAQDAAEETAGDDEIIVTAQKREENLQNVPISIQALSTRKLDQLGISDFNEFTKQLPSVSFQTSQPGSTTVYMRGVASGGDGNHSASLPSVGVYLDEQPVTTIGGTIDVHIYDIARIESLAGPQGTLYGASSQAGTIRIITNKPDSSGFAARADAEVNTVKGGKQGGKLEAMLNFPLGENAALRVVGWAQHAAGFIDNVPATRAFLPQPGGIVIDNANFVDSNINEQDVIGGRAALKVDLDDNWTVTPTVLYQKLENKGSFSFDPSQGDLNTNRFSPEFRDDEFVQAALTIEGKIGDWDLTYAGAYLDRKVKQLSDYTDYAEAYDALYASYGGLAGYFYYQDAAGNQIDPRQRVAGGDHFKKLSQELRIASPQDKRIRVVAGLFYQRQSNDIFQDYLVTGLAPLLSVNGRPGSLWLTKQERVDKDYAGFGELAFDLTEKLTLTAGGRYYKYDNSLVGFFGFGRNPGVRPLDGRAFTLQPHNVAGSSRTGVAGCFGTDLLPLRVPGNEANPSDPAYSTAGESVTRILAGALVPGGPCTNLADVKNGKLVPKRTKDDGFLYKVNLTYKPVEDVLIYGTASRGFRPGGINRRASIPAYAPDFINNFELGWKTSPAQGLRFNGAVYYQKWKSFQYSFLGENSFTQIQNGPDADIKGIEVDMNYNAGNGFTLSAAAAYTDAKTHSILCAGATDTTPDCSASSVSAPKDTRLPITPKFKGSMTGRYEFDAAGGKAHVQAGVSHQSSASSDIRVANAAIIGRLKSFTTADAALGISFDRINFELFADNIFDERGQLSRFVNCGQCTRVNIVPTQPQTFGFRIGGKF